MARVYVSSTFKDLHDCREKVRHVLRELDHLDVAMEYYVAEDKRPVDKCLQDVERCDLYVCVVAWRYGYVPEAQGYEHSITELEYRRAVKSGKPVLAFLLDEDALWPASRVDRNRDQVEAFRETLAQNHLTAFFTGDADIGARVSASVVKWVKEQGIAPARGRTNWEAYRQAVIEKHQWVNLEVIAGPEQDRIIRIPLTEVFVPQRTTAGRPAFDVLDNPAASVLREPSTEIIAREPKQVILGGPGSGKSTLFHRVMLTLCDPARSDQPVPLLIELRQYSLTRSRGEVRDFIEYLVAQAHSYGADITPDELRTMLQEAGRTLVLFDGLDEVLRESERAQIAEEFDAFARRYPKAKIVVSSRIAGYDAERLERYGFRHYTLQDFKLAEIREFVPRWYRYYTWPGNTRDADGMLDQLKGNQRLRELAGNPLLLTMMAMINKRRELPEKRWELYEQCTQVLLERWDFKRKKIDQDRIFPLGFRMTGDQKAEILQRVSMYMLRLHREGSELNAIRRQPLIGILAGYLAKTFDKNRGEAEVIANEILNHLRERTYVLAEIGEDTFGFVHRTFMEYFAACDIRADFNRREADYDWLIREFYNLNWRADEWEEVLLLLIAMLSAQGSPIRKVVDHLYRPEVYGQPWNIVFGAHCLAEAGAVDGQWAQGIVERLGREILRQTDRADVEFVDYFVGRALAAFSMLVPTSVQPPESLIAIIESEQVQNHTVIWQMKLALRPKEERLSFAIPALSDRSETVRIGAVNALEREWPGREDVGDRLIEVLRTDQSSRVRQAAVQALRDAWPKDQRIFEAIAEHASDTLDGIHVAWLIQYISSEWGPALPALEVVLQLAANIAPTPDRRIGPSNVVIYGAIATGWGDRTDLGGWLRNRIDSEHDPHVRGFFLGLVAAGGPVDGEMLGWLQEKIDSVSGLSPEARSTILRWIHTGWGEEPDVRAWLASHATTDPEDMVRLVALAIVGGHIDLEVLVDTRIDLEYPVIRWLDAWAWLIDLATWQSHPESLPLLKARAVDDPSPAVRQIALAGVCAYRDEAKDGLGFPCRRLGDERDRDTRALLLLFLSEAASGDMILPQRLAVTLGFETQDSEPTAGRPSERVSRTRYADDNLRTALTQAAEHDDDARIRAAAGQAVAAIWPE